jgi:hypothetical protein
VKRIVFALLTNLLFLSLSTLAAQKSDRQQDGLKNAVGSIQVDVVKLANESGQRIEGPRFRRLKRSYFNDGRLADEIVYGLDMISKVHFYATQPDGSTLETVYDKYPQTPPPPGPDSTGQASSVAVLHFKHISIYQATGNRTEEEIYANDGTLFRKDTYTYDADGNKKETMHYDNQGTLLGKQIFTYEKGVLISQTEQDGKGCVTGRETYTHEFDKTGNWIQRTTSKITLKDNKEVVEPFEITYRKITYYPPIGNFLGVVPGSLKDDVDNASDSKGKTDNTKNTSPDVTTKTGQLVVGKPLKRVQPPLPALAKVAKIDGIVAVLIIVDEDGDVILSRATSGHPLLKGEAAKAAWEWKFTPTTLDGVPVRTIGTLNFRFSR